MKRKDKKELINMNYRERNCYGQNLINEIAIDILGQAIPQLKELTGKDILLSDGAYRKNVRDIKIVTENNVRKHFKSNYNKAGYNSIWLEIDVTVYCAEFTVNYYKKQICVGRCQDGILTEVFNLNDLVNSYKLDAPYIYKDVVKKLNKLSDLKNQVRILEIETKLIDTIH